MNEYIKHFFASIMMFLTSSQSESDFKTLKHDYLLFLYGSHECRDGCQICTFLLDELEKFELERNLIE